MQGGWNKLKTFRSGNACEEAYNLVMEPISFLSFVLFAAPDIDFLMMKNVSYVNDDFYESINNILSTRYPSHFTEE